MSSQNKVSTYLPYGNTAGLIVAVAYFYRNNMIMQGEIAKIKDVIRDMGKAIAEIKNKDRTADIISTVQTLSKKIDTVSDESATVDEADMLTRAVLSLASVSVDDAELPRDVTDLDHRSSRYNRPSRSGRYSRKRKSRKKEVDFDLDESDDESLEDEEPPRINSRKRRRRP